jgi:hypothetical protein
MSSSKYSLRGQRTQPQRDASQRPANSVAGSVHMEHALVSPSISSATPYVCVRGREGEGPRRKVCTRGGGGSRSTEEALRQILQP